MEASAIIAKFAIISCEESGEFLNFHRTSRAGTRMTLVPLMKPQRASRPLADGRASTPGH
jgi:hypothetical protein